VAAKANPEVMWSGGALGVVDSIRAFDRSRLYLAMVGWRDDAPIQVDAGGSR
jgi:hypothetical protein